jgi:phage anti-repressor protein/phage antirepressor YoqD-like protein
MDLIKVETTTIGNDVKQTVNARELHSFMEVGKDFSTWMKDRIESFGFIENQDFLVFPEIGEKGGRPQITYHLTLDMAKELSMVERNEKGKQARQYFIECERRAKDPVAMLNDPAMLKQLLLANLQTVEQQKVQIEQRDKLIAIAAPKAAIADRLVIADGLYNLTHAAKLLNIPPREFNKRLEAKTFIYRMGVKGPWTGHAPKIKAGFLEHKIHQYKKDDGTEGSAPQVFVTAKGMHRLAQIFGVQPELQEAA